MGSPYSLSVSTKSVHCVKTSRGFTKIFEIVADTMNVSVVARGDRSMCRYALNVLAYSPEYVTLNGLYSAFQECLSKHSRKVVTLEARYDWSGHEKFARTIIFDFTRSIENADSLQPMIDSLFTDLNLRSDWYDCEDRDTVDWSIPSPFWSWDRPYNGTSVSIDAPDPVDDHEMERIKALPWDLLPFQFE